MMGLLVRTKPQNTLIPALLVLALALVGLTLAGPSAVAEPVQPAPRSAPDGVRVTLITGDRVELARGVVRLTPGPGREGIGFAERRSADGRFSVIPADALPLVGAGRLDPRLFDIALLRAAGYDDARRPDLPLIVRYAGVGAKQGLGTTGARAGLDLASIRGGAITAGKSGAGSFWSELKSGRAGIDRVWLDGPVRGQLDRSVPQIGAPTAWQSGFTGQGVKVAVLDTGIDDSHPDLDEAVVEAKDFTDSGGPADDVGHGTHVASIITGSGAASDGKYRGVAPDARLLVGKVLGADGTGSESQLIAGLQWAAAGARIVNLSLGSCATDGTDPVSEAVDTLTKSHGTLFVVAAGNHPASPESCFNDERVSSPATADSALAVASVDRKERLSPFSNLGPRVGDDAVKPEISAPGDSIVAAKATGGDEDPTDYYTSQSGTSMAAPHVAGAAALLAQQHPDWRATELKAALMASAKPNPELDVFEQGAGRVDLTTAIKQTVLPEPAALSFGLAEWPHDDDKPRTERLTYRNTSATPRTLDLAIAGDAPAGMFAVSPARLTVPAGDTASVTVTADTRVSSDDGLFGAWVTASDGDTLVARSPLGVHQEVESYDLTIKALDRAGKPATTPVHLLRPADQEVRSTNLDGKPFTVRLPAGTYDLTAPVATDRPDPTPDDLTLVARPELKLTEDTEVVLDARAGKPVRAVVDSKTAKPSGPSAVWVSIGDDFARIRGGEVTDLYATPTGRVSSYSYEFGFAGALAEPEAAGQPPRGYLLARRIEDRIPKPTFKFGGSELATVTTQLHGEGVAVNRPGTLTVAVADGDHRMPLAVAVPGRRIDRYAAGPGVKWNSELETDHSFETDFLTSPGVGFRPGQKRNRHWGRGGLGPAPVIDFSQGQLWVVSRLFSAATPGHHTGLQSYDGVAASNTLSRDGEVIESNEDPGGGTFDQLDPEQPATYRFSTRATRAVDWSTLATRVDASWTFRGPFEDYHRVPTLTARVSGALDRLNRAPADQPFPLRVRVETGIGQTPALDSVALRASFDDGETWTKLRLTRDGDTYRTTVPPPPSDARFVSLHATAAAADGTAVEQTVIRSYELVRER